MLVIPVLELEPSEHSFGELAEGRIYSFSPSAAHCEREHASCGVSSSPDHAQSVSFYKRLLQATLG